MLPEHHPHDAGWIAEQFALIAYEHHRAKAKAGYEREWQEAYNAEPACHKKENKARFAANTRLRLFVDKIKGR